MTGIVVGVDGSVASQQALRWAQQEANARRKRLIAVLGWGAMLDEYPPPAGAVTFDSEVQAAQGLEALVNETLGAGAADDIELRVVRDGPAHALLAAAQDASMLVVGARGRGGFASLLLGSVSQRCLHHAPCPTVAVRAERTEPGRGAPERIVVGVDGSPASDAAVRWAIDEASWRESAVDAVHVWHLPALALAPYSNVAALDPATFETAGQALLEQAVKRAGRGAERVNPVLLPGGAASELVDFAKGADLLVLGTRGLGPFNRFLLGSVSTQASLHTACTVVIVPDGG